MTQAAGGLKASPPDPLETVLSNVADPGRLDQTAERLKKTGLVSGAGNRVQSRGIVASMMDGSRGEVITAASTPAGGAWEAMNLPRYGATRRITIPAQNTNGTIQINAPAGKSFGRLSANSSVTVLLYFEAVNADDTVTVTVSPDNMANGAAATRAISAQCSPGYWSDPIDAAELVGSAALPAEINSIRVRVARANTAGVTTIVHVAGVIINQRSKATLVWDFDDGTLDQYTVAYPILSSYGIVANVGVIGAAIGKSAGQLDTFNYASMAHLKEMQRSGWEMLPHGLYPHNSAPLNSRATIRADVLGNFEAVAGNLSGPGQNHYILVAGQQHAETDSVLRELGFVSCRSTASRIQTELPDGVDNLMRLASIGVSESRGLANLKAMYDRVRKIGGTLRLCAHRFPSAVTDPNNELTQAGLEELAAYMAPSIASGEVQNLTASQWFAQRIQ